MIIGIGCDIVDHKLTELLGWESQSPKLLRIFTSSEIDIFNSNKSVKFLNGRFAAKEAIVKCLGTGMEDGISLTDIEILQSENGSPILDINGKVKEISDNLGIDKWHLSISHTSTNTVAFVVAEKL